MAENLPIGIASSKSKVLGVLSIRAVGNMVLVEAGLLAGGSGACSCLQRYLSSAWGDSSKAAMIYAARDVGNNCPRGVNVSGTSSVLCLCTEAVARSQDPTGVGGAGAAGGVSATQTGG